MPQVFRRGGPRRKTWESTIDGDATAGDMTNDKFHTFTYDAEGNITAVDGGSTASYLYNALNQRAW